MVSPTRRDRTSMVSLLEVAPWRPQQPRLGKKSMYGRASFPERGERRLQSAGLVAESVDKKTPSGGAFSPKEGPHDRSQPGYHDQGLLDSMQPFKLCQGTFSNLTKTASRREESVLSVLSP